MTKELTGIREESGQFWRSVFLQTIRGGSGNYSFATDLVEFATDTADLAVKNAIEKGAVRDT